MKNIFIIAILSLLTIGSYFLLRNLRSDFLQETPSKEKIIIATALGVSTQYFDSQDKLKYSLDTPKIIEYSKGFGTKFILPYLEYFDNEDNSSWKGNANEGSLSDNKNYLLLNKNVTISKYKNKKIIINISGEAISYDVSNNLITSNLPVIIENDAVKHEFGSLIMNTVTKKLKTKEHVKSIYRLNSKKYKNN